MILSLAFYLPYRKEWQHDICAAPDQALICIVNCLCRGKPYIDGSVTDFIYYDNSPLLKCNGQAFILDYSQVFTTSQLKPPCACFPAYTTPVACDKRSLMYPSGAGTGLPMLIHS